MRTVTIRAIEAVQSIRAGMDDASLMEKFDISFKGLHTLFKQLVAAGLMQRSELEDRMSLSYGTVVIDPNRLKWPEKRTEKLLISAGEALNCIRPGMSETALMRKYRLSTKGLQSLFNKLLREKLISQSELDGRISSAQTAFLLDEQAVNNLVIDSPVPGLAVEDILDLIRAGTTRDLLREEYNISDAQIEGFLDELVSKKLITQAELDRRLPISVKEFYIRHRLSNEVIFSAQAPSFGALVEMAAASGVDLGDSDLSGCHLPRIDLSGARLSRAKLTRANLVGVDLTGARLEEANLVSADLYGAILYKTNLAKANLSESNMTMVYGVWAFLSGANLFESNLTNANLAGANLSGANLFQAILSGTNLAGAYLRGASLELANFVEESHHKESVPPTIGTVSAEA
ncbi:MAG TPA: pentapeptide repeat-containing protein [Desulfomonilaceae bacterium]|nr:pentapeptide repeat-containing protein [Desulfomonilaceae bacterium]